MHNVLILIFLTPLILFSQYDISLSDAIQFGLENNIDYKNKKIDRDIRKHFVREIMSQGYPSLSGTLDYSYAYQQQKSIVPAGTFGPEEQEIVFSQPHSTTLRADLNQLVFDARYFYGLRARKALFANTDYLIEESRISTSYNISNAYYLALVGRETYHYLVENEKLLQNILQQTRRMYEEGLVDQLAVDRLELNLTNLQTEVINAQNIANNALLQLKYTIGMPNEQEISLNENLEMLLEDFDWDINIYLNPNNRIENLLLHNQSELKKYDIKQTLSNYYPNLYAFGYYGTLAQRDKFSFFNTHLRWFDFGSVGFRLTVPMFDGLKANEQAQQKKLELQQVENNIKNFNEAMVLEATSAQNSLIKAINNFNIQKKNIELADKILNKSLIMFNEGIGGSLALFQAQQDYTQAMINYSQAVYNLLLAKLDLNKSLGKI